MSEKNAYYNPKEVHQISCFARQKPKDTQVKIKAMNSHV